MATWSSGLSYADRVAELRAYLLARVTDDHSVDQLNGGSGTDWYFASVTGSVIDRIDGNQNGETVTDLGQLPG